MRVRQWSLLTASGALCCAIVLPAFAAGLPALDLDDIVVTAPRLADLGGESYAASVGTVTAAQLEHRPMLRTAEVLETVPGLVVTQHSGEGKANQYFLRGFNLDHGTDFASSVEGIPVNLPTHAHGQGYSDLNFLIPELVERIEYQKGTYDAQQGNFSAAGSARVSYQRALPRPVLALSLGQDQFGRGLLAGSARAAGGDLLYALESAYADGPWQLGEHFRKFNGVLKYTRGSADAGFSLEAMGYGGRWRSNDQIPLRAVQDGRIDAFGHVDPSDGGSSQRYSVSAAIWHDLGSGRLKASVYSLAYHLDLFSNFTYYAGGDRGDQFEQFDDRRVWGGDLTFARPLQWLGRDGEFTTGLQLREDHIAPVGLYRTQARERYATVREDEVRQTSHAAFASLATHWTPWLRTDVGARIDAFRFAVDSNMARNSGVVMAHIASPKLKVAFGPWRRTEVFLDWGRGFHSNDARGATLRVDPVDSVTPASPVTPLVRATGREVGVRSAIVPQLQLAASLWSLDLDSELVFSGDGGTTEASRASRRRGVELSAYFTPTDSWIIDADVAWSRARFTPGDAAGDRIPNAVERVASLGIAYRGEGRWFGGARVRYLGPAPLIENDAVRSPPATLVNLDLGYRVNRSLTATLTLLNALDSRANDITYYYASKLPGEAAPVDDVHFHPVEPRQLRASFAITF